MQTPCLGFELGVSSPLPMPITMTPQMLLFKCTGKFFPHPWWNDMTSDQFNAGRRASPELGTDTEIVLVL